MTVKGNMVRLVGKALDFQRRYFLPICGAVAVLFGIDLYLGIQFESARIYTAASIIIDAIIFAVLVKKRGTEKMVGSGLLRTVRSSFPTAFRV